MLILLDIDGVMVPANSWKKPEFLSDGFATFKLQSVKALQNILSETGASIMLTTSHKSKYSIAEWYTIFQSRGINAKHIDRLPDDWLNLSRKDEILSWYMTEHRLDDKFVIIDDDKSLNGLPANIKGNLVLTSASIGLTEELAENAISILKKKVQISA